VLRSLCAADGRSLMKPPAPRPAAGRHGLARRGVRAGP
jgi:hypothetical protein